MGRDLMSTSNFDFDFAVVGLGYVGLPLLVEAEQANLHVLGFNVSASRIASLTSASQPVYGIPIEKLSRLALGLNSLTTDASRLNRAKAIAVCVPTPVDENFVPDLSFVLRAAETIARQLQAGQIVILESTVAPGTTEGVFKSALEDISGLTAGKDFFLAYSPERIDPGNKKFDLSNTPKVLGGFDQRSSELASSIYNQFVSEVVIAKGTAEAEAAKLLENTYRHVNISLINEFALACEAMGIDVFDVIRLASTKPFGFAPFTPSAGAGGHCIPVDPNYFSAALMAETGRGMKFIDLANEVNRSMPKKFVSFALEALSDMQISDRPKALVLGLTYKANIADCRESPAFALIDGLLEAGVSVKLHDPLVQCEDLENGYKELFTNELALAVEAADLLILLQFHDEYSQVGDLLSANSFKVLTPLSPEIFAGAFGFQGKVAS
jgi:UDP-N-acetyl-D-glucosamine dehydrogenase